MVWPHPAQREPGHTTGKFAPLFALDHIDWVILQRDINEVDLGRLKAPPHAARLQRF
ncbi:hypothetical protein ACKI2N_032775 [Cupriavidus sp. 30B13]|uniref:hypothetical protein n=1 Tax=Cupriavidus sp. 30B13 TaxID=3384241 RepID=UPI003B90EBB4